MLTLKYIGLGFVVLIVTLVGFVLFDYHFLPTNLTICLEDRVDAVEIKQVDGLRGDKIYQTVRLETNGTDKVRFSKIKKGYWRVFLEKDGQKTERATLLVDGYESWLYCPRGVY